MDHTVGVSVPIIADTCKACYVQKAPDIVADPSNPSHHLSVLPISGRWFQVTREKHRLHSPYRILISFLHGTQYRSHVVNRPYLETPQKCEVQQERIIIALKHIQQYQHKKWLWLTGLNLFSVVLSDFQWCLVRRICCTVENNILLCMSNVYHGSNNKELELELCHK